jgi:hypothetical protein
MPQENLEQKMYPENSDANQDNPDLRYANQPLERRLESIDMDISEIDDSLRELEKPIFEKTREEIEKSAGYSAIKRTGKNIFKLFYVAIPSLFFLPTCLRKLGIFKYKITKNFYRERNHYVHPAVVTLGSSLGSFITLVFGSAIAYSSEIISAKTFFPLLASGVVGNVISGLYEHYRAKEIYNSEIKTKRNNYRK